MPLPPPPTIKRGPPGLPSKWKDLTDWAIQRFTYRPGPGIIISDNVIIANGGNGGGGGLRPFQLLAAEDGKIRVVTSTLANTRPDGFSDGDDPPFLLTPSGASGVVFGKLTFNATTGIISAVEILRASTIPADTSTTGHVLIGSWATTGSGETSRIVPVNDRFGPIDAQICWEWYADEAKFVPHWGASPPD